MRKIITLWLFFFLLPLLTSEASETYYFLQVATYADIAKNYAKAEVERLHSLGLTECFVMPSKKLPYLYIRCGEAKNREELKPIEEKLRKAGLTYRVVKVTYERDPFRSSSNSSQSVAHLTNSSTSYPTIQQSSNGIIPELIKKAKFYEDKGDYKYALKLYKQALEMEPENPYLKEKVEELSKKISWWENPQKRKEIKIFYRGLESVFKLIEDGKLKEASTLLSKFEKKGFDRKAVDVAKATIEIKRKNYHKSCQIMNKYPDENLQPSEKKLKREACYNYHLSMGYKLLRNSPKNSVKHFKRALSIKRTIDAEKGLALAYLNAKKYNMAYNTFKRLWNSGLKNKEIAQGIVYSLMGMRKYYEVLRFYNSLPSSIRKNVKLDKTFVERQLRFKEIDSLIDEGAYQDALLNLQKLYLREPENVDILLRMGRIYLELERFPEAEQIYREVLVYEPDNIYAMQALLGILMREKKYKEALEISEKLEQKGVTVKEKEEIESLLKEEMLKEYIKFKEYEKAKKVAFELIRERPKDPFPYLVLGDIYASEKELKKAHRYYAKAYMLDRENFGIKLKFLYSLLNQNMFEQIRIILPTIKFEKLSPSQKEKLKEFYIALYKKLASYYIKIGEYQKALAAAEEGLQMIPNDSDLLSLKGWACLNMNEFDCAIVSFKRALTISDDIEIKYGLALAYVKKGNYREAIPIMNEIERKGGRAYLIKLADLYLIMGEDEKAEELLRRFKAGGTYIPLVKPQQPFIKDEVYIPDTFPETKRGNNLPKREEKKRGVIFNPFLQEKTTFIPEFRDKAVESSEVQDDSYNYRDVVTYAVATDSPVVQEDDTFSVWKEYEKIREKLLSLRDRHKDSITTGTTIRFKNGESGKTKLGQTLFFIDYENFLNSKFKLNIGGYLTALSSGRLFNYDKFGSYWVETSPKEVATSFVGAYPYITLNYFGDPSFYLRIFSTPLGDSAVSPEMAGSFSISKELNSRGTVGIAFERIPIEETLLSYVGSDDPYTSLSWGRVLKTGGKVFFQQKNEILVYIEGGFYSLKGENTSDNNLFSFTGSLKKDFFPLFDFVARNTLGVVIVGESFKEDNLYFSYGKGGYFSPKYFFLIGPEYEFLSYALSGNFLLEVSVLPSLITYESNSNSKLTFGLDWKTLFVYKLEPKWFLQGGIAFQNSYQYSDVRLNFGVRYFFGKREKIYLEDIEKVKEFLLQ
jgi:tetratricopeptide (TPR) repeat protein